jgi:phage antirepressor YoqD-like protein
MSENELVVKEVNFNGDNLIALQSSEDGKIYVGVNWVTKGIGLTEDQCKKQGRTIQEDLVLKKGSKKLSAKFGTDENREVWCIELDFLPLWLAKISITPSMRENNPEVVTKLIDYQLKAKDVLAKAFIQDTNFEKQLSQYLDLDEDERAIEYFKERKERKTIEQEKKLLAEQNEVLKPKADSFDIFIDAKNNQKMNDVAKSLGVGRNNLFEFLRDKKILMSDNVPYQRFCDSDYFVVKEHTIMMGNYSQNKTQTFVTSKGIDYIRKLLKEVNYIL